MIKSFLHNMVIATIFEFRNGERDWEIVRLMGEISSKLGRPEDNIMFAYGRRLAYTDDFKFNWHPDAPAHYRALEIFWQMIQRGEDSAECFLYYQRNVSNPVTIAWDDQIQQAQEIWTPPHERLPRNEAEAEAVDPN